MWKHSAGILPINYTLYRYGCSVSHSALSPLSVCLCRSVSVSPSVDTYIHTGLDTHTHKCTKLQMCLFMVSVPLLAEATCTIPSVERGKMTTMTCHFNMNMQEIRQDIVVKRKTNASAEHGDYNGPCFLALFLCNVGTFLCSFSSLCM